VLERLATAHRIEVPPADLRKTGDVPTGGSLRKTGRTTPDDAKDDALSHLRRRGDQLVADYVALLDTPGLTAAEIDTIRDRYRTWRKTFDDRVSRSHGPRRSTRGAR